MTPASIAAVVVTFDPRPDVAARLRRYAGFLGSVIVVDNSEKAAFAPSVDLAATNIVYLPLNANCGVAHALNVGVHRALDAGHELALLLDQDSDLGPRALESALACVRPENGITAMRQEMPGVARPARRAGAAARDVEATMTSGSLLNLQAFRQCGDFEDKLFIDYVDHEYCLRLRSRGFRVVECDAAGLQHALGEPATGRFLGLSARYVSHRPFRLYYIMRNGLYLVRRYGRTYPRTTRQVFGVLWKEVVKSALLESDKVMRLRFLARGFHDWRLGRYGKLEP